MSQTELTPLDDPPETTHQRFPAVQYRGSVWDLSHLDSFAFKLDLGLGSDITVLVMFSCHCFSHSFAWDERLLHAIPAGEIYDDGRERRILNPERYALSRRFLRGIVTNLQTMRITVADERQPNFVTFEDVDADGMTRIYAVFFEAEKDRHRRRRLVLRVQSAYLLDDGLTTRQSQARKVAFKTLLRATYLGKKVRG